MTILKIVLAIFFIIAFIWFNYVNYKEDPESFKMFYFALSFGIIVSVIVVGGFVSIVSLISDYS